MFARCVEAVCSPFLADREGAARLARSALAGGTKLGDALVGGRAAVALSLGDVSPRAR